MTFVGGVLSFIGVVAVAGVAYTIGGYQCKVRPGVDKKKAQFYSAVAKRAQQEAEWAEQAVERAAKAAERRAAAAKAKAEDRAEKAKKARERAERW